MSKILVVEDENDDFKKIESFLKPEGFTIDPAENLQTAKSLIQNEENKYELAIVDIRLDSFDGDNIDGLEFVNFVNRNISSPPPILVYSQHPVDKTKDGIALSKIAYDYGISPSNYNSKGDFFIPNKVIDTVYETIYNHRVTKVDVIDYILNKNLPIGFKQPQNEEGRGIYKFINIEDVLFIEASGRQSIFHLKGKKKIEVNQQFGKIMGQVCTYHKNMFHSHGSYLINLENVVKIEKPRNSSAYVYFGEGINAFVSKSKWTEFKNRCSII